jgi:hypothetical protein
MNKRQKPHTKSEATRLIKAIARDKEGMVNVRSHAKKRMKERNVDMLDVLCAFRNGRILEAPEWDTGHNEWKYKFTGNNVNGEAIAIVTNINKKEKQIVLITVFETKK